MRCWRTSTAAGLAFNPLRAVDDGPGVVEVFLQFPDQVERQRGLGEDLQVVRLEFHLGDGFGPQRSAGVLQARRRWRWRVLISHLANFLAKVRVVDITNLTGFGRFRPACFGLMGVLVHMARAALLTMGVGPPGASDQGTSPAWNPSAALACSVAW